MYKRFYGIERTAFSLTPDPRFLVMTQAHREVKAALTYAILARKGLSVLTGDAGTGKTTLVRAVINSIPKEQLCFSFLVNPVLTPNELYELVLGDFGLPKGSSKPERLGSLLDFLIDSHAAGKIPVLFVDEAHRLSFEMLEEIRLLTNFETETEKLVHIVLVGQDELSELLDRWELRQLKQRVEVRQHISALRASEIPDYINSRWACAGGSAAPFSQEAIRLIGLVSGCVPRLINTICDNALVLGFAESVPMITEVHIREVSKDLHLASAVPAIQAEGPVDKVTATRAPNGARIDGLDFQVPPPAFSNRNSGPLSLFGPPQSKRSWWPPRLWRTEQV